MRILILGKNGQVGWELQRSLAPLGDIVAMGREEADLADTASLKAAIVAASPDIIVNAAAYTAVDKAESEPERADRVNHRAVGEIGQLAAARNARVIHYSTDYVFDGTKTTSYVETDPPRPLNVYGKTKLDGELALARSGANHLIFRTSWVHSGRGSNFVRTILTLARERDSLRVVDDQIGAPTSARLIADSTALALQRLRDGSVLQSGTYHLASSGETSWRGLAVFAIEQALAAGVPLRAGSGDIAPVSTAEFPRAAARPANSRLDTSKLCSALEMEMPDWRDQVHQSVLEILRG